MAHVFKKTVTRPLPPDAEIFERKTGREARWKERGGKGKLRTAPVTTVGGVDRIKIQIATYYCRYRNGDDLMVEESTGCRDKAAAQRVLNERLARAEKIRSGLISTDELNISVHLSTPIADHVEAYLVHLEASEASAKHRSETRRRLVRILSGCGFRTLGDLDKEKAERWLVGRASERMSARTRNTYLSSLSAFCNWCVGQDVQRLIRNPFEAITWANEAADCRRQRRALTENELVRLLDVAARRPLLDAQTIRTGKRRGEAVAKIRPEVEKRLNALGRERALIYKTLALTGLRRNELASLTVGQLRLEGERAFAELSAASEKSREGNAIPIRADLAADLRGWLREKLEGVHDVRQGGRGTDSVATAV